MGGRFFAGRWKSGMATRLRAAAGFGSMPASCGLAAGTEPARGTVGFAYGGVCFTSSLYTVSYDFSAGAARETVEPLYSFLSPGRWPRRRRGAAAGFLMRLNKFQFNGICGFSCRPPGLARGDGTSLAQIYVLQS